MFTGALGKPIAAFVSFCLTHRAGLVADSDRTALIDRPDTRCWQTSMPVRIAKMQALATQLPRALLFHRAPVFRQPRFPTRQLRGGHRERQTEPPGAAGRGLEFPRSALLE